MGTTTCACLHRRLWGVWNLNRPAWGVKKTWFGGSCVISNRPSVWMTSLFNENKLLDGSGLKGLDLKMVPAYFWLGDERFDLSLRLLQTKRRRQKSTCSHPARGELQLKGCSQTQSRLCGLRNATSVDTGFCNFTNFFFPPVVSR